jgi:phage terminase Nu1 subunit (DNA packaging protein)
MSIESIEKTEPLRLANKGQAARWFDVSPQALDGWIRRGCPAVTRGSAGVPWQFDLRQLAEWRYGRQATPEAGIDPANMTPKERLDHFRALREQAKHQQEMGELIPAEEFRQGLAGPFKLLANTVESLPDVLERDAGLTGAQAELCIKICDRLREDLYQQLVGGQAA